MLRRYQHLLLDIMKIQDSVLQYLNHTVLFFKLLVHSDAHKLLWRIQPRK